MSIRDWLGWINWGNRPPTPTPKPPPVRPPTPTPTPPNQVPTREELLENINDQRSEAGLPPLITSEKLQSAAQGHSSQMASRGEMKHEDIGDGNLTYRLHQVRYIFLAAGENIAWNQRSVDQVMQSWMGSVGHRAAILGSYAEVGLGIALGSRGDPYWCTVFGTPSIPSQMIEEPTHYIMSTPERTGDRNSAASSIKVLID